MTTLACGHSGAPADSRLCIHVGKPSKGWVGCIRWFLGTGEESDLLCEACATRRKAGEVVPVEPICVECYEGLMAKQGPPGGYGGTPEVRTRAEPFPTELWESRVPDAHGPIAAIAPMDGERSSVWLLLAEDGSLLRFEAENGEWLRLGSSSVPSDAENNPWGKHVRRRLHVSGDGSFAAVVNDQGRHGQIVDLRSGQVTIVLDGADYHARTVPFAFAFAHRQGRAVAIHRTDWNRLDVTDLETGALLTEREPTSYRRGEEKPAHYLNFFHGAILVNPSGTRLANDGWLWQPTGLMRAFSLEAWESNVWESEDGPSMTRVDGRDDWNFPMVWLDDDTLAVQGVGEYENWVIDGVCLYDVGKFDVDERWGTRWVRRLRHFFGPAGRLFSDGASLLSAGGDGLARWDPADGSRTGHMPGFHPTHHHRGARELAGMRDGVLVRWGMTP